MHSSAPRIAGRTSAGARRERAHLLPESKKGRPDEAPLPGPCQAIVIRLAPDPSNNKILNIGVALLAREHRFFEARFTRTLKRVTDAFPRADGVHLQCVGDSIAASCAGVYQA